MRLGEIKQKIDRVLNESNHIIIKHEPQYGGQAQLVEKYSEIIDVLELFVGLNLIEVKKNALEDLLNEHPKGKKDELLGQDKFNELNSMVDQLNTKLPIYYSLIQKLVPVQNKQIINIKLPDSIDNLDKLNKFNGELIDLFKKFNLSGELRLEGLNKGTSWYEILIVSAILYKYFLACLDIAYHILEIKKTYYESEEAKLNYYTSLGEKGKEDKLDQKKYSDKYIEVKIREEIKKAIKSIDETEGKTNEELATNLVMATNGLIDKLGEGVEFHLSLNPPEYASEGKTGLAIDYKKMPKPIEEKHQKQLKSKEKVDPEN